MDEVAASAKNSLSSGNSLEASSVIRNSFTEVAASSRVCSLNQSKEEALRNLEREPTIARVVVLDENSAEKTYFISRTDPYGAGRGRLVNYKAPIGRIASLPVGEEVTITTPSGDKYFEIIEKITLRPSKTSGEWDSLNSNFENYDVGFRQIKSLRSLLNTQPDVEEIDFFDDFSGEDDSDNIRESIQHEILTNMGLRDQPILDKFQDEIFRMPLDSQLLILGPPGTGKTTTLIRRLGQKLDVTYLTEVEKAKIGNDTDHRRNWVMFTPTDLLKHYLKEAFSREQVAASDHNIKTWDTHSRDLARHALDILQAGKKKNGFILKSEVNYLKPDATESAIRWFESFKSYHKASAEQQLKDAVKLLNKIDFEDAKPLVQKIRNITDSADSLFTMYSQIFTLENEIKAVLDKLKQESDKDIRKTVNFIFNQKKELINEFSQFLSTLKLSPAGSDNDDAYDADDDETPASEKTPRAVALQSMVTFIRAYARASYQQRKMEKGSKNAAIAKWLGNKLPDKEQVSEIGRLVFSQNVLRRFSRLSKNFTVSILQSFRAYRRQCLKEGAWYETSPASTSHIGQQELDLIILLMLDTVRDLLQQPFIRTNPEAFPAIKKIISDQLKNQVLVDEATDFSPIQLACMERLASLSTGSFFACGDFNQRITGWGTKTPSEFEWVSKKVIHKSINIVYRQSQKLNAFSGILLDLMNGAINEKATLPPNVDHEGVSPVLFEQYQNTYQIADWLFDRIEEIDQIAEGARPTIAVLVNSEEEVIPTASALNVLLEDINMQAEACSNGNTIGKGSAVRVFDVQHIKGLEFEAVFFVGVDKLAHNKPDLFEKYLYVGATRAATFLGLAFENGIPDSLQVLTGEMTQTWQ